MKTDLILVLTLFFGANAFAEERSGKAVYETSVEKGMKIGPKALANLRIKSAKASGSNSEWLSNSALVFFQDEVGVYRLRDGWFKRVKVKIKSRKPSESLVEIQDVKPSDEFVTHGAGLLRVAEMDSFSTGEE